ncbi:MAG TPA: Rieske (2Fe-2S) protein [Jatrophihabitans sp.]|nr:Rieske (2Fe-2S) protein [Jatrophihabitans sp.]
MNTLLERLIGRIEAATALDPIADRVAGLVGTALKSDRLTSTASGTPLAHPLHPALVLLPAGSLLSASYLDARGEQAAAQRLVLLGLLSALPAALTGATDWSYTQGAERRVGLVHALANAAGLACYTSSWIARRQRRRVAGTAWALAGAAMLGLGGWLGGHLAYARGVGVDTTAFQVAPQDWVDVLAEAELVEGQPTLVRAGGLPVLLVKQAGTVRALSDRCTHRGGPLHEGSMTAGGVRCPWHGSEFRLSDGTPVRGPASRPQPVWQVRVELGRVQVRRSDEQGALRTNPAS